jgi:8-oxo-dGTP diphosphatase
MPEVYYLPVCCAIIREGGRFLLVQRAEHKAEALKWEFPGGKVDAGETAEDCIRREIQEELGVEINLRGRLRSSFLRDDAKAIKLMAFLATIRAGTLELKEHKALHWARLDELQQFDVCTADRELITILQERGLEESSWWQC